VPEFGKPLVTTYVDGFGSHPGFVKALTCIVTVRRHNVVRENPKGSAIVVFARILCLSKSACGGKERLENALNNMTF
jgi:hypothetical protein